MATNYEELDIQGGAELYGPGDELGDGDAVPGGKYAIGFDTGDGGAFAIGTPDQVRTFGDAVAHAIARMENELALPLTRDDYQFDSDDNGYPCPRCEETFEVGDYRDLDQLVAAIDRHRDDHNTAIGKG